MNSDSVPFRAEAALTEAELDAYAQAMQARIEAAMPQPSFAVFALTGSAVALGGAVLAVIAGATAAEDGGVIVALLFLAYLAGYLVMILTTTRHFGRLTQMERDGTRHLREEARYEIGEHGVATVSATTRGYWAWAALEGAAIEHGLLLIRVGPSTGFVIPVRAFRDEAEAEAALAHVNARIAAARGKVVDSAPPAM